MFSRISLYLFTLVAFLLALTLNSLYPRDALWMLFTLPVLSAVVLHPRWFVANSSVIIVAATRLVIEYVTFSHHVPAGFAFRFVVTSCVSWVIALAFTFFVIKSDRTVNQLRQLAMTDDLTYIYNRRYLDSSFQSLRATNAPYSILVFDIDRFKQVNDTLGHSAGDIVLKGVSRLVQKNLRPSDVLIRLGGEEFAVLLPDTQSDDAVQIAERIRNLIERTTFAYQEEKISVTISGGVAERQGESLEALLDKADIAMYEAKTAGRNRIVLG
ncbi:GGDEF domain-containing protein [Alicyclobacillus sp. ALC3]|uniref:GGDEF domain-containing protein n=1 Tax=Alicyclobacillus sp. ALC3 TaxID=2796143 RepID=UPI0023786FE1|nr:GGDEF domain-containing protein [Alicyclobacillus sp. ALC3]WDL99238.1 GGDEF domain-containing protein [Alicyclobacillus sp. ALC3]